MQRRIASRILGVGLLLGLLAGCSARIGDRGSLDRALYAPVNIAFIGDSITYYWGPGQQGNSNAFVENPTWIDAGVYGQTSGQMLSRFEGDVIARHPSMVHILAGTNDVYPGWLLCGGVQNVDTCGNIKAMVKMSQAAGIQVILGTIPPWGPGGASSGFDPSPARYTRIDQLNQWIEQFAMDNDLTLIDYHMLLLSSDGKTYVPDLTIDGIHPSAKAYTLMTPAAEQAILDAQKK